MLATVDPNVLVAVFAFLTALVTVFIPQMRRQKKVMRHTEEIKDAIGVKNGNGDAMQMLAKTLGAQYELIRRMEEHEELDTRRFLDIGEQVEGVSGQVTQASTAASTAAAAAASAAQTAARLAALTATRLKAAEDGPTTG